MKIWVSTAVALLAFAPAAAAAKSCGPRLPHHCRAIPAIVNLTTVPAISRQIVDREPAGPSRQPRGTSPPSAGGYTGPTVGVTQRGRGATVGYRWSLH